MTTGLMEGFFRCVGYTNGVLLLAAVVYDCNAAAAQTNSTPSLPSVTIAAKANRDPVEKSYRKMVRGMDLFDAQRGLSPNGVLRFKLLPRKPDTDKSLHAL